MVQKWLRLSNSILTIVEDYSCIVSVFRVAQWNFFSTSFVRSTFICESSLHINMHGVAEHVALQLLMVAVMKNVKSMGPKMSPCLTPILLLIGSVIRSLSIFTVNDECRAFKTLTSLWGTPYFNNIPHNKFLGTLSKALTRSRKSTHDSKPCSLLFLMADLTVNIASMQPRFGRKPHCCSWSSCSSMGSRRV